MRARKRTIRKHRDPAERRAEARRFASRVSRIILGVAAAIGVVVIANRWSSTERVERIELVGLGVLDSLEVMERAAIDPATPLRSLDLRAIEQRLASHPFLAGVTVHRGAGGALVVEVVERRPVALCVLDGVPAYLDSQAIVLPWRFSRATFDVPVLTGITGIDSGAGRPAAALDSSLALEALDVARSLRTFDESLYRQISEIRRERDGSYRFVTADAGIPVLAGRPEDIPVRLPKLDVFMRTALAAREGSRPLYIDLRWKGQVIARWS
jgi:cell division protein FtsQ